MTITCASSRAFPRCRLPSSRIMGSQRQRGWLNCRYRCNGSRSAARKSPSHASASRPGSSSNPKPAANCATNFWRRSQGFGLNCLPEPCEGDIFLDFEGDSFVGQHGLEYLLGFPLSREGRATIPRALGARPRWREGGLRDIHRFRARAEEGLPAAPRLPLWRVRTGRAEAADGAIWHARRRTGFAAAWSSCSSIC
jgi:hypothetical protein